MKKLWKTDAELFTLARRELFTAVVGDVMDKLNLRRQFLPPQIQPLAPDMFTIGRAMPVLQADFFDEGDKPFGLMMEALDDLKPNEIYVCTGGSHRYALWGELMSLRATKTGAVGAILDGYSRDTKGILEQGFPCFSRGRYAQDQGPRGKVVDFRSAIEMEGGIRIAPGDILLGDIDGVCVVPRKAERAVFAAAIEKARGEKTVRQAIEAGMTAQAAFKKFGIL
ncbi:MAG: RraA family protein [Acidobacteria bacterium]|nr:RraA family protein [Acidobacteriota bacterium]